MSLAGKIPTNECDLLVAGSGAAGLAAAVTAAHAGLRVIVAERADVIGGTTAWSGGWIWAPCNPVAKRNNIIEEPKEPQTYLKAVLGNNYNSELVDAFLSGAPAMIDFFETHTDLKFEPGLKIPDTYSNLPGAGMGGRSVIAKPFDGRRLKNNIHLLRKPLPETSFLGMPIQAGSDLKAFMTATRSVGSAVHVTKRVSRHLHDLVWHGRAMQLRNGSALVARLFNTALKLNVSFITGQQVHELLMGDTGIDGAIVCGADGEKRIHASHGVVLACGGFPNDEARKDIQFPHARQHRTLAVSEASGDGIKLGESAGGFQVTDLASPGAWCPVSEVQWPNGRKGVFPHIIDRGKPGVIGVTKMGKRFCNEGLGYHDYVQAIYETTADNQTAESWLVCDHRFLRRYGLGIVRPSPIPIRPWLKTGYLKMGRTIRELAEVCGIEPDGLHTTIAQYNKGAIEGRDDAFGRGTTPYMRLQGDPENSPNPCVAPIELAPFYAVRVIPGSFGTFAGLQTDGNARVLNKEGKPVNRLYAAGTDMASVMGGHYPAGGINLGPALTFGFLAGRHASGAVN